MTKRRQIRKGEVICLCRAYKFPHRLTGGKCIGRRWVSKYWQENQSSSCANCHLHYQDQGYHCEALDGRENTFECPAFAEYLDYNEVPPPKNTLRTRWG